NLEIYRSAVEQRTMQVSGVLGLTSPLYKGKLHSPGVFYGKGYQEIIIATDDDFWLRDAKDTWREWEPVRVLSHPRSDLGYESLDGQANAREKGFAVITVNIPMLACQYKLWRESPESKDGDSNRLLQHFVLMYPLTNALRSHLDVALFNRLSRLWFDESPGVSYRRLPFYTTDLRVRVDQSLRSMINRMLTQSLDMEGMLKVIPALYRKDALRVHQLPRMAYGNQILWGLYIARLNLIRFLVHFSRINNNAKNTAELNRIKRSIIEAESSKYLVNGLPVQVHEHFSQVVNEQIAPFL